MSPRAVPPPVVARLQLTQTQKSLILDRFKKLYADAGKRPDIKLEAFAEMVEQSRSPAPLIPLYFAQKRLVLAFAREAELPWLADQINTEKNSD
jgi:hypothetical protein